VGKKTIIIYCFHGIKVFLNCLPTNFRASSLGFFGGSVGGGPGFGFGSGFGGCCDDDVLPAADFGVFAPKMPPPFIARISAGGEMSQSAENERTILTSGWFKRFESMI
jgi:hypothetical protein